MLETRRLSKRFDGVVALQETDLRIRPDEFLSILGPSGCGKTTLLRLLGGFETPSSGEIFFDSRRIDPLPPERRPFNLVFQRYALFPHLSVRDNVAFGPRMRRRPEAEIRVAVEETLALVHLEGYGDRRIQTLSGGQQQRVALARALINRPKVLLLDEPLSALDLKLRERMRVELRALQRRLGHAFVLVTHDQDEALALSDRIAVMNHGRIEQVGTPREIYERPATAFVARFIGSISRIPGGLIRPERLLVSPSSGAADLPGLEAVVSEVVFQGPITQLWLRPQAGGEPLLATCSHQESSLRFAPGDRVRANWRPQDVLPLEDREEAAPGEAAP